MAHVDGVVVSGVVFLGIYGGEAAFFVEVFEVLGDVDFCKVF